MDETVVPVDRLELRPDRKALSPPWLVEWLYQCATAVTVRGFVAHASLELEIDGTVLPAVAAGFPEPLGAVLAVPALVAGRPVRVRQTVDGITSGWSPVAVVRDHTVDFPAGPPRPQVVPTPLYTCGSRSGVGNLLGGANVWITGDGVELGRVNGCATPTQGVNVNPFYTFDQKVIAHTELCGDEAPPSIEHRVVAGPNPPPAPGFEPVYEGGEQLVVTNVTNGARVSITRGGTAIGTFRCWGGSLMIGLSPALGAGEQFSATQQLCPGDQPSDPGTVDVLPCSALGAPTVGPVQAGDTSITITSCAPGAVITVYRNLVQAGQGGAPVVQLNSVLGAGDTVHVTQSFPRACPASVALQLTVACVDPHVYGDPSALDLFPVGHTEYSDGGAVHGSVYYPADDDGDGKPFNTRLAKTGRVPVVVLAHGNHDPGDPSYLGYDYFQATLAKMGIVAVSVDCNATNGYGGDWSNIEARADLIIDSIKHFQTLDGTPGSLFADRLDFGRVGLMGHSRGGDAVVLVPTVIGGIGVTIRSVLALAPTNFAYWEHLPTIGPAGYAFATILPAADGDVVDNNGAQFYDLASAGPFCSQIYVDSANHNFFNRQWALDDGVTPVHARPVHERILAVYGSALFRSTLLGDGSAAYLLEALRPAGVPVPAVHLSYRRDDAMTVDNHDDGNGIGINSLGRPTSATGGAIADEYPFDRSGAAFNGSFFGLTTGMVLISKERDGGDFRSEIGGEDLRDRQVWVRAGEVATSSLPSSPVVFELGLEDGNGSIGWVSSVAVGGVPRPFARPDTTKTMPSTLRFNAACVHGPRRFDLRKIVAVHLRSLATDGRALAVDDLQFV
jgi:dienelactone hydrolase